MPTRGRVDINQDLTVIERSGHLGLLDIRDLWSFRELLWMLARRDIKVRYKHTVLGALWAILRPALLMLIFSVVFGRLARVPSDGMPYPVFVLAGLLPWMFFAQAVTSAGASVLGAGSFVSHRSWQFAAGGPVAACCRAGGRAGGWNCVCCGQCRVSRFPPHRAVFAAALDVCHASDLPLEHDSRRLALAGLPQSNVRGRRRVSRMLAGPAFELERDCRVAGIGGSGSGLRGTLFRTSPTSFCRHHLERSDVMMSNANSWLLLSSSGGLGAPAHAVDLLAA